MNNKANDVYSYFSIDESGNLLIPVKDENGNIVAKSMEYKESISKYTTSMNFFLYLAMITKNPEFVSAVTDLVKLSEIRLIVLDTQYEKEIQKVYTQTENTVIALNRNGQIVERDPTQRIISGEKETTSQSGEDIQLKVAYVKTWFCEQKITYTKKTYGPYKTTSEEEAGKNDAKPKIEAEGIYTWLTDKKNKTIETTTTTKYEEASNEDVSYDRLGKKGSQGVKDKNNNGKVDNNEHVDENTTFIGLLDDKFKIPNSNRYKSAGEDLVSGAEWFFHLLQQDSQYQNLEEIMRYALYLYTGTDYGVTQLDANLFNIANLNDVVYGTSIGKEFTKSWENNALRKYMNGESSYDNYVSRYITADNTKFICYTDTKNTRNYGFGICHYTGGVAGGTSNNHESKYMALGIDITAAEYNQLWVSQMDVDIVNTIFSQVYSEYREEVLKKKKQYAPDAPELTEQQIICLTDMRYQGCIKWKSFFEIYATQDEERIKNYIINAKTDTEHDRKRGIARWEVYSEGVYNTPSGEVLEPEKYGSDAFLGVAKQVWLKVVNGNYVSWGAFNKIPPSENATQIDCSGYVSWVLYEYGYTDFTTKRFARDFYKTNWNAKYGWTEIAVGAGENPINILRPGDIFVRYAGEGSGQKHVLIVESIDIENGKLYAYDCGSANNWLKSGGNSVDKTYFLTKGNPGKIIRVN